MEEKTQFSQVAQPIVPPDTSVEIKEEVVPFAPVQTKKSFPIWIVLLCVALLVVGGGIFFFMQSTTVPVEQRTLPTPPATVQPTPDQVEDLFLQRPTLPTPFLSTPSATFTPVASPSAETATASAAASQSATPR